ncbi:chemotaxis protein CheR [Oscillatoriales cyanobacterium LEGE 11467]|uniref:protein-glutamate O-methyltransferase n=1 Tax=Zarconia navalis LEGE 11467 TaxID=1828826 RepID=A0A928Z7L0_9CYAN|nr:CheR family methyltransferase [Zarconia navalis]MBE9039549.1 chemotaxis protein CheR [Zarconia navalis LEGE 11467]
MNQALMQKFIQLISRQTGLYVRLADLGQLQAKLLSQMRVLGLRSLDDYYQVLERISIQNSNHWISDPSNEWQELINSLTVTESYFFRDSGQFDLLKDTILPSLIEKKRKSSKIPKLKIWSAACSSGEEPYSLAILLRELLPDLPNWDISILGTDINQNILKKAKQGLYGDWSFRSVDPMVRKRYFTRNSIGWEIDRTIREMVKFEYLNLVTDRFPSLRLGLETIDLILCRNVFIYFESEAIEQVLGKFHHTLQSGGYLMSAHAELPDLALDGLQTLVFPNSAIYRKTNESPIAPKVPDCRELAGKVLSPMTDRGSKDEPLRSLLPTSIQTEPCRQSSLTSSHSACAYQPGKLKPIDIQTLTLEATSLLEKGAYPETIKAAQHILEIAPDCLKGYLLIAIAYANLGDYQKATYYCVQATALDSLSIEPRYLLARIAEVQGNMPKAKNLLKQIIYLDPSSVFAYLELAAVYRKERQLTRASKMQSTALELLGTLPSGAIVDPIARLTAGDMLEQFPPLPMVQ